MPQTPFSLLDPKRHPRADADRNEQLTERRIPAALGSHREAAQYFQPSDPLIAAVNVALAVGAPLLLTGEPGTGKTQVAHYLAWYFGLEESFYRLDVKSTTAAEDLLYHFDSVAYFHAANVKAPSGEALDRTSYIKEGPFWKAIASGKSSIVLIDEIDKAPRDFPNDLLGVLDQNEFFVREWGANGRLVKRPEGLPPPIIVITSNSERRLPEPFLRRCIFHHIEFTEEILRRAVEARRRDFPLLDDPYIVVARQRLMELRGRSIRKKPATAEFLVWLVALNSLDAPDLDVPLGSLPALSALVKDRDDLLTL